MIQAPLRTRAISAVVRQHVEVCRYGVRLCDISVWVPEGLGGTGGASGAGGGSSGNNTKKSGCGCRTAGGDDLPLSPLLVSLFAIARRAARRPSTRDRCAGTRR